MQGILLSWATIPAMTNKQCADGRECNLMGSTGDCPDCPGEDPCAALSFPCRTRLPGSWFCSTQEPPPPPPPSLSAWQLALSVVAGVVLFLLVVAAVAGIAWRCWGCRRRKEGRNGDHLDTCVLRRLQVALLMSEAEGNRVYAQINYSILYRADKSKNAPFF
jgi:hypothetical protein